jgi:2-C-methyl-D-erythritol 4-phosphate cytidylyltransferase/2-C-methyl-D-erythritol 2,4-cyclodiphosphate synthase
MTKVHAVVPAAGRGVRFGSGQNKVFAPLAGKTVLEWTLDALLPVCATLVVVARDDEQNDLRRLAASGKRTEIVVTPGGATRQDSVACGLAMLDDRDGDDIVLVHDSARPLVSRAILDACISGALASGAAIAALPVSDSLKSAGEDAIITGTVDRSGLWAMQTPQAFRLRLLRAAHAHAMQAGFQGTDEAAVVEHLGGHPVRVVPGARENIKITEPADLVFAEQWLSRTRASELRVGLGYDIHRLVPGRPLWLGGVEIPSELGLDGHSDADALLHAVCDALLGAVGLPDIGHLFPNTDDAYKGVSSLKLLAEVHRRLLLEGWVVGNIDCMVIAERPKIAPYIAAMRDAIAGTLETTATRISIKATTNEGLGALGAGEGIACHATAAVVR